jgi:CHAT domain-containing protein/tetratricopeptide (TPR) repeat protein
MSSLAKKYRRIWITTAVISACSLVWLAMARRSEFNKELEELGRACESNRPFQGRLCLFGYAPHADLRGDGPSDITTLNNVKQLHAERAILESAIGQPGPEAQHAVGVLYLNEGKLDNAVQQLELAVKQDPRNARYQNDLGLALFEKSRKDARRQSPSHAIGGPPFQEVAPRSGESLDELGESFEHLSISLKIAPSMPEGLFNRGMCLTEMVLPQQAEEAWKRYLEVDSTSGWASEALRHLDDIRAWRKTTSRTNEEYVDDFLRAYESGDDDRAWSVYSQSREVITGKYVLEQMLDLFLTAMRARSEDDAQKLGRAITYAGKLDRDRTGDTYAGDVARFYRGNGYTNRDTLSEARRLMRSGYLKCLALDYKSARSDYEAAAEHFSKVGDGPEGLSARYWIAYSSEQDLKTADSASLFNALTEALSSTHYSWLLAQVLSSLGACEYERGEYSRAIDYTTKSIDLLKTVNDSYGLQKHLSQMADVLDNLGNLHASLDYLQWSLDLAREAWPSSTQMWRTYDTAGKSFRAAALFEAASEYERGAVALATGDIKVTQTIAVSYIDLGLSLNGLGDRNAADEMLSAAYEISKSSSSQSMMAYTALKIGEARLQTNQYLEAISWLNRSIEGFNSLDFNVVISEARKGRLECYMATGADWEVVADIDEVLDMFDQHRSRIADDANKISYFETEQDIFDLATNFEYSRMNDAGRAFNYSERSKGRSLFDVLPAGSLLNNDPGAPAARAARPLGAEEILSRLPQEVEVIHYAVLKDKTLIWLIRDGKLMPFKVDVSADTLTEKVSRSLQSLSGANRDGKSGDRADADLSDLFGLLIAPVAPQLDPGKQLFIVPDKALCQAPFAALKAPSGKYLIEEYGLPILAPSCSVLLACSKEAKLKGGDVAERALVVANPSFDRNAYNLPPLKDSEREALQIKNLYPDVKLLLGPNATLEHTVESLQDAEVCVLASHYLVDPWSPGRSKLLLASRSGSDERTSALEAADLEGLKLSRTRLVVLSACRSGVEGYHRGEGLVGMARPFIAAGVPLVLASLWPVDSRVTADLMIAFHTYRKKEHKSTVDALRQAELDILNGDATESSPFYWAAFTLIGGHATY